MLVSKLTERHDEKQADFIHGATRYTVAVPAAAASASSDLVMVAGEVGRLYIGSRLHT